MNIWGKPHLHAEADSGWEHFSNLNISGAWEQGDWDDVFAKAQRLGVSVEDQGDVVVMWKGRSQGRFLNVKGGVKEARDFLEGVA